MFDDEVLMEELILNNCKPYLKLLKHLGNNGIRRTFLRGSATPYEELTKIQVEERSSTMNTDKLTHEISNEWFKDNFDIAARSNTVFVTANRGQANKYGFIHYVFPLGKFQTIHSNKISDLFLAFSKMHIFQEMLKLYNKEELKKYGSKEVEIVENIMKENIPMYENTVISILEKGDYKKNEYTEAIKSNNEIMLKCKSFYIVEENERIRDFLNEFVWSEL